MGILGETSVRITADTAGFHGQASKSILGSMVKIGASAAAIFGGIKLGKALFVDPIKSAGDFQQTLNVLQATSGATDAKMKKLSATAMRLGADVRLPAVSASDAANAMLELAKGGLSADEAMGSVRATLLLSTAAQIDGATASVAVASAMGQFGLKARDTQAIVDDFAGAANNSTASMNDVSLALQQSGGAFHTLGIPIGDATTAIAAMANAGYRGSDAGTALKTMLQRLNPQTKQAKKAFEEMGVSAFDSNEKFVGFRSVIEQLTPKLAGMTDKQKTQTLATVFGSDAARAANVIFGMTAKQYDNLRDKVTKAGQAQKIANAQTKGFNGAVAALRSGLETLQLRIGMAVIPKLSELVKWLGKIVSAPNIDVAIKIVWKGVVGFATDLKAAVQHALFGGRSQDLFGTGMVRITSESIAIDVGIVEKLRAMLDRLVATTDWSGIGKRIGAGISDAIEISTDAMNTMLDSILSWVNANTGRIAEIGLVIGLTMISKLLDPGFWAEHWQLIGGIILSSMLVLFPAGRLAEIGVKAVGFLLKPFAALGSKLGALGVEAVLGLAGAIERTLGPLAGRIALWIGDAILRATSAVVGKMVELGAKLIEALINKLASLGTILRTLLSTAIVTVIGNLIGAAVGAAVRLADGIVNAIKSIPGKFDLKAILLGALLGPLGVVAGLAGSAAMSVAEKIASAIKTAPAKLASLAGDLSGKIAGIVGQVMGSAFSLARGIGFAIADGVLSGVGNLAGRLKDKLVAAVTAPVGWARSAIEALSPSRLYADMVGAPIGDGIVLGAMRGLDKMGDQMGAKLKVIAGRIATMTKANAPEIATAFGDWAKAGKERFDAEAAKIQTSLEAQFTKAKAVIEKWKAKLTPAELQIQVAAAIAAANQVQAAVDAANMAIRALPAAQAQAWSELLAQQAANIASLQATLMSAKGDAAIAGHDFAQGLAEADPSAQWAIQAQKHFDTAKALFEAGALSEAEFVAAHDVLQAAVAAIDDNANAKKLLDQYNTWQAALVQEAAAGAAITTQQAADQTAQADLRATFNQQQLDAQGVHATAVAGLADFNLKAVAELERKDRDTRAALLNTALTKRYERTKTHLDNITKATNTAFDDLAEIATKSGGTIAENLAKAMRDAIPLVGRAAASLAAEVRKYLKTSSPAEAGPMADLDKWWSGLAPTLIASLDSSRIKAALSDAVTPDGRGFGPGVAPMMQNQERSLTLNDGTLIRSMAELIEEFRKARRDGGSPAFTVVATGGVDAAVYASKR